MTAFLNIAGYRFVELDDLPSLRAALLEHAQSLNLRGTVLLAPEGINLFLAGDEAAIEAWLAALCADPRFAPLTVKRSWSDAQPFGRLKVKLKREIIRMDMPAIRPVDGRAPSLPGATLARWLTQGHDDEGREVVMVDTRNGFEVDEGAFENAIDWRLRKFTEFPTALRDHLDALRDKTVVSYCTGGIRCEKAAIVMQQLGLDHSWQLEGGILQYFEDTAGAAPGWRGRCFVFDERVSLDPALAPST